MYFKKSTQEVVNELQTNEEFGLSSSKAASILAKDGYNELVEKQKDSWLKRFVHQFADPLVVILIIAAVVSIIVDPHEWVESLIIFIVVVFNAVLGVTQESNAEKSLEALKQMSAPNAKVIRDNERLSIPSRELVVGDIVIIEAGDFVASDGRVLESHSLQIDESALTGESLPVKKRTDIIDKDEVALGDQKNMVFASTVCTYGRGKMVVISTGMQNEVGKIAGMLMSAKKEVTPLQIKLAQISKIIGVMALVICVVVFGLEYITTGNLLDAFKSAVALAVAAIPEGLATVVTIVLAIGVTQMVKQNAIVRKLPAVETLGSASIVCSDKTGTLTQNKMTIVKSYVLNKELIDFNEQVDSQTREMMMYFTMCSDAELKVENNQIVLLGDPTETALVAASYKLGDTKEELSKRMIRKEEIAFDSNRKLMTVFYQIDEQLISITKGAPDVLLGLSNNASEEAAKVNEEMAKQALRVLAVGIRKWDKMPEVLTPELVEQNLTLIGLAGMIDPPRPEVAKAISQAKSGGIRTIMITGDHVTTATAIAKQLGILEDGLRAITGEQLNKMDDRQLESEIESIGVYARVAPEHKVRIVTMWQKKGHVVAMTGDGVNDSPSLKSADIGCAMGITGTDVTKGAADIILTDDNFATIITAVKQGRGIYNNIKKDVQFLLSSNIGEVVTIFVASILNVFGAGFGSPLAPVHLLWVNLVTDTLPAFAIGLEPIEDDVMQQKPRAKSESFFANHLGFTIAWQGIMIGLITLAAFILGNSYGSAIAMSMAFMTLAMAQLFHAFNIKSSASVFSKQVFNNKYLWLAFLVGMSLQLFVMYMPGVNQVFQLVPLNFNQFSLCLGLAVLPIPIVEVSKLIKKMK